METREFLGQIIRFERQIKNKLDEIYKLRCLACNITVSNDDNKVQTSMSKDKIGSFVAKIADMENEVDRLVDKRSGIVSMVENIGDTMHYDVLANVYILGKDLKVVAVEKCVSYRHFIRLHEKAIREFEEKYGKMYL